MRKKVLEKFVKMTSKTLFDQNKLVFRKHDAVMNPKLVLKLPKVLVIIASIYKYKKNKVFFAIFHQLCGIHNFLDAHCGEHL